MTTALILGGGQAGLAAAKALREVGFRPKLLEAGEETAGSWPRYYASLELFTPAWFNAMAGLPFPGDPFRYPGRDEVADYLRKYSSLLDCDILTGQRVTEVIRLGRGFGVRTAAGAEFEAPVVVSAIGSFANPHRPPLPRYSGRILHSADYLTPEEFTGQRVVVVGAGNSAVQIAVDLTGHARVSLATRKPVQYYTSKKTFTGENRFWKIFSQLAKLPLGPVFGTGGSAVPVIDFKGYQAAVERGEPDRRDMFTAVDGTELRWADGSSEHVDAIIYATGFRPYTEHLRPLGMREKNGYPLHRMGLSREHPGLAFLGLEMQRTFLSASIHGVSRDAVWLARRLKRRH